MSEQVTISRREYDALNEVARRFDAWYCESGHLCNLHDAMKSDRVTMEQRDECLRLVSLLNASIHLSTIQKEKK